jgi:SAM-dependent methyltransferase
MVVNITFRNRFHLLSRDFALLGPMKALRYYFARLKRFLYKSNRPPIPVPQKLNTQVDEDFDRRFGVDTSESSVPSDLCIRSTSQKWGVHYVPTPEYLFREMLQCVEVDLRNYVFVDFGAGKGRALLMASEYPFKRIIGVEYSESLAAIGQKNIRVYESPSQQCRKITYLCSDVTGVILPEEPIVLYFYNAFQGKVMNTVIRNIENSLHHHPRDLWIIYYSPWERRKFKRSSTVRIVESNWQFCVYRSACQPKSHQSQPSVA